MGTICTGLLGVKGLLLGTLWVTTMVIITRGLGVILIDFALVFKYFVPIIASVAI